MSWALTSAVVVTVAVVAMAFWFERTRPEPRVVALVAAMAALAVAGRVAFAPLPSVKPTTDIVLLAGFAFGAVPGFAVGASTALISNVAFGQGLHTPWQMLAWGAVGVVGALFARAMGQRTPPVVPLAFVCALAAVGYSLFVDLSTWVAGVDLTLRGYLAVLSLGAPFIAAHAIGSFVFAIAFGRPMLTALQRAKSRAEARWEPAQLRPPTAET